MLSNGRPSARGAAPDRRAGPGRLRGATGRGRARRFVYFGAAAAAEAEKQKSRSRKAEKQKNRKAEKQKQKAHRQGLRGSGAQRPKLSALYALQT